jgi:hypothetical protein
VRFNLYFLRGQVKARSAVNAVGVEQRHGGQLELSTCGYQLLGQGSAFQKAESRAGVKLDVHHSVKNQPRIHTDQNEAISCISVLFRHFYPC